MNTGVIINALPDLWQGFKMTLLLTAVAIGGGFILAWPVAIAKRSRHRLIRWPVSFYVYFFRGTPLIMQLFLVYFGLGQFNRELRDIGIWWFFRDELNCALFVLVLHAGAYAGEIFRGGLQGVPSGEVEAARALGMSRFLQYRRILIPKALRMVWPAYTNECVFMMQATSLVSLITVTDLFRVASQTAQRTFAIYEMYLTVAVIYLAISYVIILAYGLIDRRINGYMTGRSALPLRQKLGMTALFR